MRHPLASIISARGPPTLWPLCSRDEMRMMLAIQACEEENRYLKTLVVTLSEIVLRIGSGAK